MFQYVMLPAAGFLIGLIVITMGGGGGAFYVGILTGLFNIPPAIAASTSLATMIPTTAAGAFSHWKAGNVSIKYGLYMLAGGAAGAIAGSLCSGLLPQNIYAKLSGLFMIALSVQMLVQMIRKKNKNAGDEKQPAPGRAQFIKAIVYGAAGGAMSGLVGLSGSGPIIVGLAVLGCGVLEIVGTSVLVLLGVSTAGFFMHLKLGDIDWPLVGLLLAGTTSGAVLGPMLLKRINKNKLEKALKPVLFLLTMGMGLLLTIK